MLADDVTVELYHSPCRTKLPKTASEQRWRYAPALVLVDPALIA